MIFFFGLLIASSLASAAPLPFDDAVREMLRRDTEVGAVSSEAEAAAATTLGKRYHFLPSIRLDGTETWAKDIEKTTSFLGTANVPLFRFGADALALKSASAQERSARARLERVRLDREKKAIDALLEYIRATETREILISLETMGSESVKVAERQYTTGRVASQEVEKVKIDLENTRFRRAEAEQAWVDARSVVEALLGSGDVMPEFPWKERIEQTHALTVDPTEVLKLRPDWIEAEAESRSTDFLARSAFRGMLPELSARLSYGWTQDPLFPQTYREGWIGAMTLSIPIFNAYRDYATYRFQTETANAAERRQEGVKRQVLAETLSIPTRYEIARKSALDREGVLKMSRRLYQDSLSRFRQGRTTSNELNIDFNRYLETQLGAVSGWVSAHQAYVELSHLRGRCATECGQR